MIWIYNLLITVTAPFWVPWMWFRARARKVGPNWAERRGIYKNVPPLTGGRKRLWFHAVSVGEVIASLPILRELRRLNPDLEIVLSVTTSSGHQTAVDKAEGLFDHLIYFPIDIARYTLQALVRIRPSVVAIMETELWMNFLHFAKELGATTLLINGRISDRSFPKSLRLRFFYKALLSAVDLCLMQSKQDQDRILALGASNAEVLGNCKIDEAISGTDADSMVWREKLGIPQEAKVVVLGSTRGEDEEALVIEAMKSLPGVVTVHAPRHLERVEALAKQAGATLRSQGGGGNYIILDTYGELSEVFCIADVVVIGGGFGPYGGQNLIQPLAHGKPVIHGPHMENFRDAAEGASKAGATRVCKDATELTKAIQEILENPALAQQMGEAAKSFIEQNKGASLRYAEAILSATDSKRFE